MAVVRGEEIPELTIGIFPSAGLSSLNEPGAISPELSVIVLASGNSTVQSVIRLNASL